MTSHEEGAEQFRPDTPFGFGFGFDPTRRGPGHPGHSRRRHHRDCDPHGESHERVWAGRRGPGAFMDRGFGPGFGRGFGPGPGFGFGFGDQPRGRGRGRGQRGDVRAAILALLVERPMHGYEMIREIAERSNNIWRPSPGSVYPTLQLLVDEGLIVETDGSGSRKQFELTPEGREGAAKLDTPPWEKINDDADPSVLDLRSALGQLMGAVAQSAHAASPEQQQRIIEIVNSARKQVYGILGETE
ncbi:helix-turn-helix transcriptional regulator [Mycobacterium sp. CBMA271]|uniref:PadR family transcriptional regulator n=1 Tax=unclassified Mycobacteroides TaxID=2618759 RepID=UPI0012DFA197|nr:MULTISPECIES: PadR family transcriptional regulator [unclassified Mycobacteroides]MUM19670.1 PadR family transcriptional regulator [Mycobacteroides sp. CBMA 326]MUM24273.1 helix-turn-helix transcriptional regulator [Mycobacteroides sp. CBMA 271]